MSLCLSVLQDQVNRKKSIDLLISVARQQRHRQFILLTPLSLRNLPEGDSAVTLICLRPPERGQLTLDDVGVRAGAAAAADEDDA